MADETPSGAGHEGLFDDILNVGELTKSQRRVAEALSHNPQMIAFADTAEVARRAGVNNSTVVRTAQALGYRGWPDLQRELRSLYLTSISTEDTLIEHGAYHSPLHQALERDIANLRHAGESNSEADADAAVELLAGANRILVFGLGSFAGPASVLAHLGKTMGYNISHEARGSVHIASAMNDVGEGDVIVIINLWRTIGQLRAAATAARAAGARVLVITDMRRGFLSEIADNVLVVPSEGVSFFQSITATTSLVYGLLAGMEAAHPERSRQALRRTQQLWKDLDIYLD